jgi:Na+-translocating ferredoxin:NAD+ oxidoreductase RnfA subunit
MGDAFLVLIGAVLAHNVVLTQLLGVESLVGLSKPGRDAAAYALLSGAVLIVAAMLAHAVEQLLLAPLDQKIGRAHV